MIVADKSVGVFTTDRDLVVRSWDPWLVEATGISAVAACGRSLGELFPEVRERGFLNRMARVAADGIIEVLAPAFHRYFIACQTREPSHYFAHMQQHVTLSPLRVWGEITGVVVTIEDVTDRLERERELAAQLHSSDEAIRMRAARALGDDDEAPAGALANALADESWRVRRMAAEGLARGHGEAAVATLVEAIRERHRDPAVLNAALVALAHSRHDVLPSVVQLMSAPDADVRTYAALALGQLEDSRAVPALMRALEDPDTNVRYHAIEALGRLRARTAAEPIAAIAEARDFFLSFVALDALAAIGERSVTPRLLALLEDELLQGAVAEALGKLGDEEVVAPLGELLTRPGSPAASIAAALANLAARLEEEYGEDVIVADLARRVVTPEGGRNLIAALAQARDTELRDLIVVLGWLPFSGVDQALAHMLVHPTMRWTAAEVLARRGTSAIDALVNALGTEDDDIRRAAATALGQIGSPRAVPALLRLLHESPDVAVAAAGALGAIGEREAFEPLLGALANESAVVRHAVVSALNSIGHPDMPSRIEALLDAPSPRLRESAAKIAGYFGYARCIDRVIALCADPDEGVRRAAVEHAVYLEDPRALQAILEALRSAGASVRAAAARALAHAPRAAALPPLLAACKDPDPWVRYHAARSVSRHKAGEAVPALRVLASSDPVPPVRIAAIEALGELGTSTAIPELAQWAESPDDDLARAAITALGSIVTNAVVPPLVGVLHRGTADRQLAALTVLGRPGADDAVAIVEHTARAAENHDVRTRAIETLGRIGTDRAIAALFDLARDARTLPAVTAALARAGEDEPDRVSRGLLHLDTGVRCVVVDALARIRNRRASRLIAGALSDSAAVVRYAAAHALRRRDRLRDDAGPDAFLRSGEGAVVRESSDALRG